MKRRGLLIVFIFSMGIVFLLFFSKTGNKTQIETKVDQYLQAQVELTRTNMQALQKIVVSYIAGEGQVPKSLQDLRNSGMLMGAAIDAWGRSFNYEKVSDSSFRLISAGKDGAFGTSDDIVLDY
jgi:hypothetical protein